jgi:hypothetical protein
LFKRMRLLQFTVSASELPKFLRAPGKCLDAGVRKRDLRATVGISRFSFKVSFSHCFCLRGWTTRNLCPSVQKSANLGKIMKDSRFLIYSISNDPGSKLPLSYGRFSRYLATPGSSLITMVRKRQLLRPTYVIQKAKVNVVLR